MYNTFETDPFTYTSSIDSNKLRLLKPVHTDRDRLLFKLVEVSRSTSPPYTAVSYTWGDEESSEIIHLNGKVFPVRRNLWSLLYYLSQAAELQPWDYLWVDAVCINQNDQLERSAQVSLMDQTYRDAICASVWLGLVRLPDELRHQYPTNIPIKTVETDLYDWGDSMMDLANRPYWSRFWVIQEFLLARDVVVYCSNTSMNWMDFKDILCRVSNVDGYITTNSNLAWIDKSREYGALPLVMGRHLDKHPEILQPLHDLLVDHRNSKCKEPRDRIFALLGLVTTDEQRLLRRLLPDYGIPEDHVLVYTLAHLIQYGPLVTGQYERSQITVNSVEIFQGLGVYQDVSRRKRLFHQAENFDYLASYSKDFLRCALASTEESALNPSARATPMDDEVMARLFASSRVSPLSNRTSCSYRRVCYIGVLMVILGFILFLIFYVNITMN